MKQLKRKQRTQQGDRIFVPIHQQPEKHPHRQPSERTLAVIHRSSDV